MKKNNNETKYNIGGVYNVDESLTMEEMKRKIAELNKKEDQKITITAISYTLVLISILAFSYFAVTYFLGPLKF